MGTKFDAVFPAGYDVEVIESAPEEAYVFERSGSVHTGDVVVEVTTDSGRRWVGIAHAEGAHRPEVADLPSGSGVEETWP